MLKQTEKRGHRAREDFKTFSAPWYKPQSYTELRTTPGRTKHMRYGDITIIRNQNSVVHCRLYLQIEDASFDLLFYGITQFVCSGSVLFLNHARVWNIPEQTLAIFHK